MRHWSASALLAAVVVGVLVVGLLIVLLRGEAVAQEGELSGSLPFQGGFSLNVWSGGSADDLLATAEANGCRTRSFFANRPGGGLVGYFPTPIAIVNRDFLEVYPGGVLPPQTPVIVVCNPGGTPPPTATPTPTATPEANQPPTIADLAFSSNSLTGTLTASVTDADGEVTSVTVEWGDGASSTVTGDFANISQSHIYRDKGLYDVELTAVDDSLATVAEHISVEIIKIVHVRVDSFTLTSQSKCDNFSSNNEFSGKVTMNGATSDLATFNVTLTPPRIEVPLSASFQQDLVVRPTGSAVFSVGGSLVELDAGLEGADDNLGSFSRTIDADFFGFSSSVEHYTETLSGDGCTANIGYQVSMDVQQ